jgi:hypothetical protein
MRYKPEGFVTVLQSASGLVTPEDVETSVKKTIKPVNLSILSASRTWEPVSSGPRGVLGPEPDATMGMFFSLLPSLRTQFTLGFKDQASGKVVSDKFTSSKALHPNKWTHICVNVDADSVDFYFDGGITYKDIASM